MVLSSIPEVFLEKERWGDIEKLMLSRRGFEKWTLGSQDAVVALSHDQDR